MRPSLIQCLQIAALVFWTIAGLQVATQQAARLLAYDTQLGAPLLEAAGVPVYPFWRIIAWRFAFGQYAPTTFATVYPSILFGIAAGVGHAFVLLFVPDASVYHDPFRLALRPPPRIPWRPSPNARLSQLIVHAEAEVRAAKRDAIERAVRSGEAEAAKRLAEAERAQTPRTAGAPVARSVTSRGLDGGSPSQEPSGTRARGRLPCLHDPDPNQLGLPFGSDARPATGPTTARPSDAPPPPITNRRHRMDFL
ncbi:hypothetical protein [Parvularcula dongshanensis]|uniref:Uncharacterized protein n=1 Tax=Parvularcula dongshanensis TaxID=1173995 RepID=A0A840I4Q0_9PROT|nr:hypothetical protein [Parvularcula dongshanensis]MBB4659332.1 hypothetical protein [Parvularcula dongshanensis]